MYAVWYSGGNRKLNIGAGSVEMNKLLSCYQPVPLKLLFFMLCAYNIHSC